MTELEMKLLLILVWVSWSHSYSLLMNDLNRLMSIGWIGWCDCLLHSIQCHKQYFGVLRKHLWGECRITDHMNTVFPGFLESLLSPWATYFSKVLASSVISSRVPGTLGWVCLVIVANSIQSTLYIWRNKVSQWFWVTCLWIKWHSSC